ncbi:MAG TPA: bifunctional phosphoribosylaminoimidazolecarboxamide formyltransferase/IMP cyclohydrolase [bacterium]|nr:bifunctional phosphoribosylaminoimidazolecarboxamide formyltransferase/IMP cyclohydrolase [bacterium]
MPDESGCFSPIHRVFGVYVYRNHADSNKQEDVTLNVKRALISVSDKTGIIELANGLKDLGIEIISTGGTARLLGDKEIPVIPVEKITGFPEMMDGRVKTLHPKIHGAFLGLRENPEHVKQAESMNIQWIDLVVVNLYPFEKTVAGSDVNLEEAVENIDIGGPAMLRSAAKNYRHVAVVTDPADYPVILDELKTGEISLETRQRLAVRVFRRTADYDSAIDRYLSETLMDEKILRLHYEGGETLRYGENSHQRALFYRDRNCGEPSVADADILNGKEMSYNNYIDADAALEAVKDLPSCGVAVIKHTNPCGYATGKSPAEALERAWAGDPISAFGSVIACNSRVDLAFAQFLKGKDVRHVGYIVRDGKMLPQDLPGKFVEVIIAPGYDDEALELLSRTKALRLLRIRELKDYTAELLTFRKITGGMLQMERDLAVMESFQVVTKRSFDEEKTALAEFTMKACKHTKSNAIVLGRAYGSGSFQLIGMGAGQPNRVDSLRKLAVIKAMENLQIEYDACQPGESLIDYTRKAMGEMVLASDAFFPFDDTVRAAAEYGIRYIVQPGGSKRDQDSIDACDELGMAMAFTGMRHFRH